MHFHTTPHCAGRDSTQETQNIYLDMAHLTEDKSLKARWTCVYPAYIDKNKTTVRRFSASL